jgi:hypothetical protein
MDDGVAYSTCQREQARNAVYVQPFPPAEQNIRSPAMTIVTIQFRPATGITSYDPCRLSGCAERDTSARFFIRNLLSLCREANSSVFRPIAREPGTSRRTGSVRKYVGVILTLRSLISFAFAGRDKISSVPALKIPVDSQFEKEFSRRQDTMYIADDRAGL